MDLYEIMFIQNPDLGEEDREKLFTRFRNTVSKNGAKSSTHKTRDKTLASKSKSVQGDVTSSFTSRDRGP